MAADVPDVEFDVLVGDRLDVEADGGDGGYVLVEFEFVEDGWEGVKCFLSVLGFHIGGIWKKGERGKKGRDG